MDQATIQLVTGIVGSSGLTGVAVQALALWREKKGWRADMAARMDRQDKRIEDLEKESPTALIARLEQAEEFRENDKRELLHQLSRLRSALNVTLDAISKIHDRLGITAV